MKRRIFATVLAVAIIASILPTYAFADEPAHKLDTVEEIVTPATCSEDGLKKLYFSCILHDDCDLWHLQETGTEVIPATGEHQLLGTREEILTAPTCSQAGEKQVYMTCACGFEIPMTETESIPATNEHQMLGKREEIVTPAACNQEGLKKIYMVCTNEGCDFELHEKDEAIPALVHQMLGKREEIVTPAACNQEGLKKIYMVCTNEGCDFELYEKDEVIPALIHQMLDKREEIVTPATCNQEGLKKVYMVCTNEGCGFELYEKDEVIPKQIHQMLGKREEIVTPATCTQEGLKRIYMVCTNEGCGFELYEKDEVIPDLNGEHVVPLGLGQYVDSGDCTKDSYRVKTCVKCGEEVKTVAKRARDDHHWKLIATTYPNGCKEEGVSSYKCKFCPVTKTETVAAKNHEFADGVCECGAKKVIDDSGVVTTELTATYNGKEFSYIIGMTWREWINSEYNTLGFKSIGGYVRASDGKVVVSSANTEVSSSMIIQKDAYKAKN